jgi:hypothetical protein
MRLIRASLGAVGIAVLPLDTHEITIQDYIMMYCSKAGAANIVGQLDATISDLGNHIQATYSQTTTAITVTFPTAQPHTLGSAVDYVTLSGTGIVGVDGTWPVASVTNDTVLVLTSTTSQTKSGTVIATPLRTAINLIAASTTLLITPLTPVATAALPAYTTPWSAVIFNVTTWTAGTAYLDIRQIGNAQ